MNFDLKNVLVEKIKVKIAKNGQKLQVMRISLNRFLPKNLRQDSGWTCFKFFFRLGNFFSTAVCFERQIFLKEDQG